MNSNILKGATLATLLCTVLTSCEDKFVEYNTNSYEATYDQMLADDGFLKAYITQMERSVILYNGYVSFNETPTMTKGEIMTVSATISLMTRPVRY